MFSLPIATVLFDKLESASHQACRPIPVMRHSLASIVDPGEWVLKFFHDLPDWLKLVAFVIVTILWMVSTVWGISARIQRRDAKRALRTTQQERDDALEEVRKNEERLEMAMSIDDPWSLPISQPYPFKPMAQRRVKIVSVLNLKGGVGKTTLTANLAAMLASEARPVLVVDLDFQGTLTADCLQGPVADAYRPTRNAARLLADGFDLAELTEMTPTMTGLQHGFIVTASDPLQRMDTRTEAGFILQHPRREVRFRYRQIFHDDRVSGKYGLILFDCPPRLTASSVNAIACSDYILIPTKLDRKSIDAIPRTVTWLDKLHHLHNVRGIGIIANEVLWHGNLPQVHHRDGYAQLKSLAGQWGLGNDVFEEMVKCSKLISNSRRAGEPACAKDAVRPLFEGVVAEFIHRLSKLGTLG